MQKVRNPVYTPRAECLRQVQKHDTKTNAETIHYGCYFTVVHAILWNVSNATIFCAGVKSLWNAS